jgi:hypothetical protein
MTQLDMFAAAPVVTPVQKAPPEMKAEAVQAVPDVLDVAIDDIVNGWPMIDCSGAHHIIPELAADWLRRLRGMASVLRKKDVPYSIVQDLRQAGVASFRYDGASMHVRFNEKRILELGAESRRRFNACLGIDQEAA